MKRAKAIRIYHEYGITEQEYYLVFDLQGGRCPICGTCLNKPHIDHNHATGKIRGILCQDCNWGLGQFKDNPESLRNAAEYLIRDGSDLDVTKINTRFPKEPPIGKVPDWRKVRPTLNPAQLQEIAHWTPDQMRGFSEAGGGYSYKTYSNYRLRARAELGLTTDPESTN